jgi:Protein of unknown function (DUF3223)
MGAAQPFTIATMPTFPKKGDVIAFFREMLGRYADGERVSDEDARHLLALLKHHTESDAKIGPGIAYFKVDINTQYKITTRSFWIVRPDGQSEDFSFHHCITPKKS